MTLADTCTSSKSANLKLIDGGDYQVVAICILLDRIDVEVVERSGLRADICDGVVRLTQGNVVAGVPGENDFLGKLSDEGSRTDNSQHVHWCQY